MLAHVLIKRQNSKEIRQKARMHNCAKTPLVTTTACIKNVLQHSMPLSPTDQDHNIIHSTSTNASRSTVVTYQEKSSPDIIWERREVLCHMYSGAHLLFASCETPQRAACCLSTLRNWPEFGL
jgi:hypothetical protein